MIDYLLEQKVVEHPNAVKPLFEEFSKIMPVEFLDGLPPMRDIQHHINLIMKLVYQTCLITD